MASTVSKWKSAYPSAKLRETPLCSSYTVAERVCSDAPRGGDLPASNLPLLGGGNYGNCITPTALYGERVGTSVVVHLLVVCCAEVMLRQSLLFWGFTCALK